MIQKSYTQILIVLCVAFLLITQAIFSSLLFDFGEYHIVDTARLELYPHAADHPHREFMMHVWIPREEHKKVYPLILFSHGLGDSFNGMSYTQLCEHCASRGYVVASVSHPYGCKKIQLSDGRVVDYAFPAPFHSKQGRHMFDVEIDIWMDDMACALDECMYYNADQTSALYNTIDFTAVGIMGHSLGGSTAIQLCRRNNNIAAVINLDGPLYGPNCMAPIEQPFMLIAGNCSMSIVPTHPVLLWRWYFNQFWLPQLTRFMATLPNTVYNVTIDGIVHDMFSDNGLLQDPTIVPLLIDGNTAHALINFHVDRFFDCYLKHN